MIDKEKKIIRKKAISNVNEKIAYLQKKPSDYTKDELRDLIVKEEKKFKDGFLEGKRQYNWPNGMPKEINEFKQGILTGHTYFYFSNGKLRKMAFFNIKGQKDSIWTEYHRSGILKDCIIHKKGKQIKRYYYDKAGNQIF